HVFRVWDASRGLRMSLSFSPPTRRRTHAPREEGNRRFDSACRESCSVGQALRHFVRGAEENKQAAVAPGGFTSTAGFAVAPTGPSYRQSPRTKTCGREGSRCSIANLSTCSFKG